MTEIKRVTMKAYNNQGEEILFADLVKDFAGPDLYQKDFKDVLKSWKHSDWVHASDYIAPLAAQVIVDACELDSELYNRIMTIIEESYDKLWPIINEPHLTRIK